jgi:nucleoid-associated protein EbfC
MNPEGGLPDLGKLLQQAQQMQTDLMAAQDALANEQVEGSASGGLVKATVSGTGELLSIRIDPSVVVPDEVDTLEDLVVAAVADATRRANDLQQSKMGAITGGLGGGLGLPGLG